MNIQEIKEKSFDTAMRGYRPEEVNSYLGEICSYIKELQNEKLELLKKMEVLAVKVEEYRKDEESIQEALLGAQKLGKSVVAEAKQKAEMLTQDSEEKSQKMLFDAKEESEKILFEAKSTAKALLTKAKTEAAKMEEETKQNIEHIVRSTKYQIDKEQTNLFRMQKEVSIFKSELLDLYRSHIDLIKKLPEIEDDKLDKVRDLNKKIYEQKTEEKKHAETIKEAQPEEAAEENAEQMAAVEKVQQLKSQETKEYDKAEIKETVNPQFKAVPEEKAEKPAEVPAAETPKEEAEHASVGEKQEKSARDHYTKKYGDLQFGGKSGNK